MKVGDLVRGIRWSKGTVGYAPSVRFGVITKIPSDDRLGSDAVVQWTDGAREEVESQNFEVINEGR